MNQSGRKGDAPRVVLGKRRFRCYGDTLLGLDFSPTGDFDDRPSMIVEEAPCPVPFISQEEDGEWTVLKTEKLELRTRENDRPFTRRNLEIRWIQTGMLQFWRPGDRDYQNLGGTLRSLDRYGEKHSVDGVHPADLTHPDAKGMDWLAWLQCETDVPYYKDSPAAPENAGSGNYPATAGRKQNELLLERTFNKSAESIQFSVGILSKSGCFLLNDTDSAVFDGDMDHPIERDRPGYQRWFFFGYGRDYRQGLADYVKLCGKASLPTRNAFGIIFSRWPAWKQDEARELVETFESRGYPLSMLVLDMEWHKEGWGHWEWNDEFFPDPQAFFDWIHERGMEITLNDHPLYVRSDDKHFDTYVEKAGLTEKTCKIEYNGKEIQAAPIDICDPASAKAFLETCHRSFIDMGLDFWWNDGTKGLMDATWGQLVGNRLFFRECERDGKRGMNLARYGGMGNHRYGLFFTGDTTVCWDILKLQVEFNIRAGNLGISSVSHDMGGFCIAGNQLTKNGQGVEIIDPLLYKRWLQFGVFNPVLRFHCAPGSGSRQPWDYDSENDESCKHWLQVRNSLTPYIYSAAREHYDTGIPVTRGHYLDDPDSDDAYRFDQYMFGPQLLVAPVLSTENKRTIYLPKGHWWEFESNQKHAGGQEISKDVPESEIPVFVKAGSILPRTTMERVQGAHVQDLLLDVYPGGNGESSLYEDDGRSSDYAERFARTTFTLSDDGNTITIDGHVSEGRAFDETRNLVIRIPAMVKSVALNGDALDIESKQLASGSCEIQIGEVSAEKFNLRIERGQ